MLKVAVATGYASQAIPHLLSSNNERWRSRSQKQASSRALSGLNISQRGCVEIAIVQ